MGTISLGAPTPSVVPPRLAIGLASSASVTLIVSQTEKVVLASTASNFRTVARVLIVAWVTIRTFFRTAAPKLDLFATTVLPKVSRQIDHGARGSIANLATRSEGTTAVAEIGQAHPHVKIEDFQGAKDGNYSKILARYDS